MKKFSLLLAVLMLIGMLAACNTEGDNAPAEFEVPGYLVNVPCGKGWTSVEDTLYDLELTKGDLKMYVRAFSRADFVDMLTAEELYTDELDGLLSTLTDTAEKEALSTYTAGDKTVITSMHTGKEGETDKEFYCFCVDFGGSTGTVAWVAFAAKSGDMSKNKASFKSMVDGMTCTAHFDEDYDPFEEEYQFDENGELIVEESEPTDAPGDMEEETEPTTNPPEPTETTEAPTETPATTEAPATTEG